VDEVQASSAHAAKQRISSAIELDHQKIQNQRLLTHHLKHSINLLLTKTMIDKVYETYSYERLYESIRNDLFV